MRVFLLIFCIVFSLGVLVYYTHKTVKKTTPWTNYLPVIKEMNKIVDGSFEFHQKLNMAPRSIKEIKTAGYLDQNRAILYEWDFWMIYSEILIAESKGELGERKGRIFIYSYLKDEYYDLGYPFTYNTKNRKYFILYWAERISHDGWLPGEKLDFNWITKIEHNLDQSSSNPH